MKIPGSAVTEVKSSVNPFRLQIPNGDYEGKVTGYVVEFIAEGNKYFVQTKFGVRGFNIPAIVSVESGRIIEIILK